MKIYLSNSKDSNKKLSFKEIENSTCYDFEEFIELIIENNLSLLKKNYNSVVINYLDLELKKINEDKFIIKDIKTNKEVCELKPEGLKVLVEWILKNRQF